MVLFITFICVVILNDLIKFQMYRAIINVFFWLLIKSADYYHESSVIEVDEAVNKIVLFNLEGFVKK